MSHTNLCTNNPSSVLESLKTTFGLTDEVMINGQQRLERSRQRFSPEIASAGEGIIENTKIVMEEQIPAIQAFTIASKSLEKKYIIVKNGPNKLSVVEKISTLAFLILCILNFLSVGKIKGPKYSKESANKIEVLKTIADKMAATGNWDPNNDSTEFLKNLKVSKEKWLEIATAAIQKSEASAPAA